MTKYIYIKIEPWLTQIIGLLIMFLKLSKYLPIGCLARIEYSQHNRKCQYKVFQKKYALWRE